MAHMTLDELKAQNAAAEAHQQQEQLPAETDGSTVDEPETPDDDQTAEGEQQTSVPDWMLSGDQASPEAEGQKVPAGAVAHIRQKLKKRLSDKDSEIDRLRKENETLRQGHRPAPVAQSDTRQVQAPPPRPRRDDFLSATDPDAAYDAALEQWHDSRMEHKLNEFRTQQSHQQQQTTQQQTIQRSLDQHVDRAAAVIAEGHLTADEWNDADDYVRRSVDAVMPGQGSDVVDQFISRLGKGSEKVMIALSRNASYMDDFRQSLRDDPNGLAAMAYLGSLKAKFEGVAATSRTSRAPRPGTRIQGDTKTGSADMRAYNNAHKSGNRQKAFEIKMAAKRRGVDVSAW